MPIERKPIEIDGLKYEFVTLPVSKQTSVFVELIRQLGETVVNALASGKMKGMDLKKVLDSDLLTLLPGGMTTFVERVDSDMLMAMAKTLFEGGLVGGETLDAKW